MRTLRRYSAVLQYAVHAARALVLVFLTFLVIPGPALAQQEIGDAVLLVERARGIPGHPGPGVRSVSHRFPGRVVVTVTNVDTDTGWLEVDDARGNVAWIVPRYVASVVEAPADTVSVAEASCYTVGAWNLEHFGFGKSRGFPENTRGGPSYPSRTPQQFADIAAAVRDDLQIRVLLLSEVNGEERETEDGITQGSDELDALVAHLGRSWAYEIAASGGSQRVAILYDSQFVRLNAATEIRIPSFRVGGKDIFDRDPLVGHFTFLEGGADRNDFLAVALHLASGQHRADNHDAAMARLLRELEQLRGTPIYPSAEADLLLGGDLNASRYDTNVEQFFEALDRDGWKVLAPENGTQYPATRVAGVPLQPRSQIDYLIVSSMHADSAGLFGEEIVDSVATVHHELADAGDWDAFRATYSDHFPVTICIRVIEDTD